MESSFQMFFFLSNWHEMNVDDSRLGSRMSLEGGSLEVDNTPHEVPEVEVIPEAAPRRILTPAEVSQKYFFKKWEWTLFCWNSAHPKKWVEKGWIAQMNKKNDQSCLRMVGTSGTQKNQGWLLIRLQKIFHGRTPGANPRSPIFPGSWIVKKIHCWKVDNEGRLPKKPTPVKPPSKVDRWPSTQTENRSRTRRPKVEDTSQPGTPFFIGFFSHISRTFGLNDRGQKKKVTHILTPRGSQSSRQILTCRKGFRSSPAFDWLRWCKVLDDL